MSIRMKLLFLCAFAATSIGCLRGFDFDNPCDSVDCDDGSMCTSDRCTFNFSGDTTCWHDPVNEERDCGFDGVTLACREGLCGAESLCAGVNCDDDNPCTIDACDWDGVCRSTPVRCDDGNDCTDGRCDSATGACVFEPGDGFADGYCFPKEGAGAPTTVLVGECAEGVCGDPCDPNIDEQSECPIFSAAALCCCPGSEYCRGDCGAQPATANGE